MLSRLVERWSRPTRIERLGLAPEVRPVAIRAMGDSLLRSAVHSGLCTLATHDLVSNRFYERPVASLLADFPSPMDWCEDISAHLAHHVSSEFVDLIGSPVADRLVSGFAHYYVSRLPVLVRHVRFSDLPQRLGFSREDELDIAVDVQVQLDTLFPEAGRATHEGGLGFALATGTDVAERCSLNTPELVTFVHSREDLVELPIACLEPIGILANVEVFITQILENRRRTWWFDYRRSYEDTLKQWAMSSFFAGHLSGGAEVLVTALEGRLDRREWLIRAGVGWHNNGAS